MEKHSTGSESFAGRPGRRAMRSVSAGRVFAGVDPAAMTTIAYPCGSCADGSQMYCLENTETGETTSGQCAAPSGPQLSLASRPVRRKRRRPRKAARARRRRR